MDVDRKEQPVLIGNHARIIEPSGARNQLGDNPHQQAAKQIRSQSPPGKLNVALQEYVEPESCHRTDSNRFAIMFQQFTYRTLCHHSYKLLSTIVLCKFFLGLVFSDLRA